MLTHNLQLHAIAALTVNIVDTALAQTAFYN